MRSKRKLEIADRSLPVLPSNPLKSARIRSIKSTVAAAAARVGERIYRLACVVALFHIIPRDRKVLWFSGSPDNLSRNSWGLARFTRQPALAAFHLPPNYADLHRARRYWKISVQEPVITTRGGSLRMFGTARNDRSFV